MVLGLLLASAGFAAAAIGSHGKLLGVLTGTSSTSSTMTATTPGQRRVTICHRTHSTKHPQHTITVAQAAVAAHLRHGDKLGACVVGTTTNASTTTTTSSSHGNSQHSDSGTNAPGQSGDVHGNSGQSGHGNSGQGGSSHGNGHDDS